MKEKTYPTYKPSGIDWIGQIPDHWKTVTVGRVCKLGRGRVISSVEIAENQGIYPVYSSQTTDNGVLGTIGTYDFDGDYVTWTTDGANAGTVFFRSGKFSCTNVCGTMLPTEKGTVHLPFLPYILNLGTKYAVRFDINPKLMNGMMSKIVICLPPYNEQRTITNYLDQKTALIDSTIQQKERLIELLQEERTAIINRAVTRGLDPNVPLKDSGVEWLGQVPEHWEVKRFKFSVGRSTKKASTNHGLIVALENILSGTGEYIETENTDLSGELLEFSKDDILFCKLRPYLAKVLWAKESGSCVSELLVLRGKELVPGFLYYRVLSSEFIKEVNGSTYGSKMPRASWEDFISQMRIGIPPLKEQEIIVEHLIKVNSSIYSIITRIQKEIYLLQEYRTAIINEVVTGKRCVT